MAEVPLSSGDSPADDRLYTARFFRVFAALMLFMTGVALQFHFGQYVAYLGHGVDVLGRLLSISMLGTLLIRLFIGRWIDRLGCRPVWLVGTCIVAASVGSMQLTGHLWLIAVLRATMQMATAAVMTTVAVMAAQMAPPLRRAESIGSMGLAGFTGMMVGPTLGDWIFAQGAESIVVYRVFFCASAVFSLLAGGLMLVAPASQLISSKPVALTPHQTRGSSQLRVIRANWPGTVLLIAMAFSMAWCVQSMFLERLAEDRGFENIKVFFLTYAPTAIILRVIFRRVPEQIGRTKTLVVGAVLFVSGVSCLTTVHSEAGLVLPALFMGAGHCFIFPSMIDLGAAALPTEYRGTGTALVLACGDLGMLIGFGSLGELIDAFGFKVALLTLAGVILFATSAFTFARRAVVFSRRTD
ncbi:MAG: MFS transporter [Phycisphaerales bacterium]|nr:MAG: MFS transporter [Phycisphaerales bacterium]